jgi:hypothetical protein
LASAARTRPVEAHDDRDVFQPSPDEMPAIDIKNVENCLCRVVLVAEPSPCSSTVHERFRNPKASRPRGGRRPDHQARDRGRPLFRRRLLPAATTAQAAYVGLGLEEASRLRVARSNAMTLCR